MLAFENFEDSGHGPRHLGQEGEHHQDDETTKKILRALSDTAKRIDGYARKCQNVAQIFYGPEILGLQNRLRSLRFKLFQCESSGSELKTVELEWRKCVYEPITLAKRLKSGVPISEWTLSERTFLKSHLINSIGHYNNFLMWLQQANALAAVANFDFAQVKDFEMEPMLQESKKWVSTNKEWLEPVIHRCLMCLGDLSRYHLDLVSSDERSQLCAISQRHYHQAMTLQPNNGLPYNQLATLSVDLNFGLNSVFYYLRSLTVKEQFEGSEANLRRFFDQKSSKFSRLLATESQDENGDQLISSENSDPTELAILHLLILSKELLFEESTKQLPQLCQQALRCVQRCLYVQQDGDVGSFEAKHFSEQVATKMILILLLLMTKLEEKGQNKKLSMVRAYLLALFTHFVSKVLADLQFTFFGPEAMMEIFQAKEELKEEEANHSVVTNGDAGSTDGAASRSESRDGKRSKVLGRKKLDRFRRKRRKPKGVTKSGNSDSDSDLDYSLSDESERDVSKRDDGSSSLDCEGTTEDDSSESEDNDDIREIRILDSDSFDDTDYVTSDDDDDVVIESSQVLISVNELATKVREHHLVEAIRICSLWLMSSREFVREAGPNLTWLRLSQLFNTTNFLSDKFVPSDEMTQALLRCRKLQASKPFPEDFQSRGIKFFESRQKGLNWKEQELMTSFDMGVYRLLQLCEFRDWLSSIPEVKLSVNPDTGLVEFGLKQKLEMNQVVGGEKGIANNKEEKHRMMQNMAQLWLQQEVKDLEGVGRNGLSRYSPFVVIDHLALIWHLPLVREIVQARKFAVIIPSAVIQELDDLKRNENGARNAIRWLEREFKEGNRWLRAQKPEETRTLKTLTYPKKKDKVRFQYFKIYECCHYFSAVSEKSSKASQSITLLTSCVKDKSNLREQLDVGEIDENGFLPPRDVADSLDILVEDISKFAVKLNINPAGPRNRQFRRNRPERNHPVGGSNQNNPKGGGRGPRRRHERHDKRDIRKDNG